MVMGVPGLQYKEVVLGDEDVARRGKGDSGLKGSGAWYAAGNVAIISETRSWI